MPIYNVDEYNDVQQKLKTLHFVHPLPTDCGTSNYPRLMHNETTWKLLQNIFHENNGGGKKSYHHRIHARHRYLYTYSGLYPRNSIEVRNDVVNTDTGGGDGGAGRGRTLYASQDIPKNTNVWLSVHSSFSNDVEDAESEMGDYNSFGQGGQANKAYFCSLEEITSFLQRLSSYNLQCDILLWAYATKSQKGCVECELDEASYFNHGEHPHLVNINSDTRAARDIEKGEELLMNYNEFIAHKSLDWWDELRNTAWKEEEEEERTTNDDDNENEIVGGDAMNEYVKYGKPKSTTASSGAAAAFGAGGGVDAASISIGGGGSKKIYSFFGTTGATLTTSIFMTLFLMKKGFLIVQQQQRRRRRR
jgi:hypothetical protein